MNIFKKCLPPFVGVLLSPLAPQWAMAMCTDMEVTLEPLSSPNPSPDVGGKSLSPMKASLFLRCMGGTPVIPGTTLIQTVREHEGKLCYSDLACGNTNSWAGYIGLSGTWIFYDSVLTFLASEKGQQAIQGAKREYDGQNIGVSVGLEWGQITRHCKPIAHEICM
jgi:hypothetical protein